VLYWASSSSSSPGRNRRRRQQQQQSQDAPPQQGLASLSLADVLEVREGTAPDPAHPGQVGTATLRRRRSSALGLMVPAPLSEEQRRRRAEQGFSLLTAARSLDLEALTPGDYRLLFEGFKAAVAVARAKRERESVALVAAAGGSSSSSSSSLRSPRAAAGRLLEENGKETGAAAAAPPAFGP
jgi:hypothetical protein